MTESSNENVHLLIDEIDPSTRANIMSLDQKLRGIQAEVQAKLKNLELSKKQVGPDYKESLTHLLGEIDMAIEGIDVLVSLTTSEDEAAVAELLQSDEAQGFSKMLEESLEKIKHLNNDF